MLGLRIWLVGHPLRLAPAWATLAGALASGGLRWRWDEGLLLLLAIFLTDGLWGQLWTLLVRRDGSTSREGVVGATPVPPLPYAVPTAPVARLWHWLSEEAVPGEMPAVWRALLIAALVSFGLALLLKPAALLLTVIALLLAALARLLISRRWSGALAQALFEIGLTWLLGHLLFASLPWPPLPLAMAASYVLLHMGELGLRGRNGLWLLNLAQFGPVALLIMLRHPLAAGVVGVMLLPPLAWQPWLRQGDEGDGKGFSSEAYLQRARFWWWAGMLLAAWAVAR